METVFKTYNQVKGVVFRTAKGEEISQGVRAIKNGSEYSHLIDTSDVKFTSSFSNGGVDDTVHMICKIIKNNHNQVSDLANFLEKSTRFQTLESIWNFVFNHIQYKNDKKGVEQLSTPARIWLNRSTPNTPSDCDDHTIFVGSLLYCLGIPFTIRIAGYEGKPFSHVYIVSGNVCIDTVLHRFNCEAEYSSKKDTKMQIETLQGYGGQDLYDELGALQSLSDSADNYDAEIEAIEQSQELNGIGSISLQREENALKSMTILQLSTTLKEYAREPEKYYALGFSTEYWQHMREALKALENGTSLDGIIIKLEDGSGWETANLSPLNGIVDEQGNTVGLLGTLEGFFKKLRKKIKKGIKAVGKGIKNAGKWTVKRFKKIGKFMMKINPINIAIRAVLRARISKNANNLALKMGYGLLSLSQAQSIGIEKAAWEKSRRAYSQFAKKYRFLGGKESKLRKVLAAAWQKAAKKAGLPSMLLNGLLGELDGRRRRRRRKRRKKAAAEKRRRILLTMRKPLVRSVRHYSARKPLVRSVHHSARPQVRIVRHTAVRKPLVRSVHHSVARKPLVRSVHHSARPQVRMVRHTAVRKPLVRSAHHSVTRKPLSRYEKERLDFLKLIHADIAKQEHLNGTLGILPAAVAAPSILSKVMAFLKPILKMLNSLGLGDFIEKMKQKRIESLSKRIGAETDPEKKEKLIEKKAKAENNLVIFQKEYTKPKKTSKPNYNLPNTGNRNADSKNVMLPEVPITEKRVNTESMNPLAIGAMVLIGGGLLWGANQEKKDNSKKSK